MPNEFEKIVQQKMDELNLVPSEPVWQKVEMQIRKKKDRRRVIFWILFLGLLVGGSLWMGIDHYSNDIAYHKLNSKSQEQTQITSSTDKQTTAQSITTNEKTNKKSVDKNVAEEKRAANDKLEVSKPGNKKDVGFINEVSNRSNKDVKTKSALIHQAVVQKQTSQKIQPQKENIIVSKETVQVKNVDDTGFTKTKIPEVLVVQPFEKINQVVSSFDIIQAIDTTRQVLIDKIGIKPAITNADSLKRDTASIKTPATKKLAESKWKFNLVASSGLSGLNNLNFLSVLGGQKSMDASYFTNPGTSQSPGASYYRPSSIRKGLSFSFGTTMQKQLSKRLKFLVGLQYNYYSNSILVGSRIRRDTVFRYAYAVSQYYQNNAATYSLALEPYHDHYHFISLPLTIDWQLFKKLPLNFYAGFSIQQMIQTNALVFDYNAQAYYHNNKAFNKTLVFTEYGLNYSIPLSKTHLSVGPEFHYGLSSLEKNNPDHHLFSYGLKAQLQLNKK